MDAREGQRPGRADASAADGKAGGGAARSLGLFLTDTPPAREPFLIRLEIKSIDIPAGQTGFVVEDSYVLPADVDATSIYPHAHYLAREMQATATLPDGTEKRLLVDQGVGFPLAGSISICLADRAAGWHEALDADHLRQLQGQAPSRVKWGPKSTDEMGAMWLEVQPRRARICPRSRAITRRVAAGRHRRRGDAGAHEPGGSARAQYSGDEISAGPRERVGAAPGEFASRLK